MITFPHHVSARAASMSCLVTFGVGFSPVCLNEKPMCWPEAKWVGCFRHTSHSSLVAHPLAASAPPSISANRSRLRIDPSLSRPIVHVHSRRRRSQADGGSKRGGG